MGPDFYLVVMKRKGEPSDAASSGEDPTSAAPGDEDLM
jgi:hypothetical protein